MRRAWDTRKKEQKKKKGGALAHTYLSNHHMAIERALTPRGARAVNMRPDLGDDGGAKCHVRDEVAVHLRNMSVIPGKSRPDSWQGACGVEV